MPRRPVKAEQTADAITHQITAGRYAPTTWLPSLRDLAKEYQADPRTISHALEIVRDRQLIELVPNRGARVLARPVQRDAADITRQIGAWRGFHAAATRAGAEAYTDTHHIGDVPASPDVAARLGIPVGTTVLERGRVQGVLRDGVRQPIQISATWVRNEVVDRVPILRQHNTGPGGMGSRFNEAGYTVRYEESVTARMPDSDELEQLAMEQGAPVLVAWRRCVDQDDQPLEVTVRIINPALHELTYSYS